MAPHPLQQLSHQETLQAKEAILAEHGKNELILIREIFLQEPPKADLIKFLELEHSGRLTSSSPRPARSARCQYDVVGADKNAYFHEAIVDLEKNARVHHEVISQEHHPALKLYVSYHVASE